MAPLTAMRPAACDGSRPAPEGHPADTPRPIFEPLISEKVHRAFWLMPMMLSAITISLLLISGAIPVNHKLAVYRKMYIDGSQFVLASSIFVPGFRQNLLNVDSHNFGG